MGGDLIRAAGLLVALGAFALVVTRVDAGPDRASVRVVSATGAASTSDSLAGDVVVRASGMGPGNQAVGTVTAANAGDATGAFRLKQSDVLDTPGPDGARMSTMLGLNVDDGRTGRPVYRGVLGAMDEHPAGYLRAGEERTYRFTLTFPAQAPAGPYSGSRVETTFDWTAETAEPPPAEPRRDRTPPRVVAQAVGPAVGNRTFTVALTCDERCAIVGTRRWQRPGRPALYVLPRRSLRITVRDEAGNRVAVPAGR